MSSGVSSTSPQPGQVALIVVTGASTLGRVGVLAFGIGTRKRRLSSTNGGFIAAEGSPIGPSGQPAGQRLHAIHDLADTSTKSPMRAGPRRPVSQRPRQD